jgi:ribosome-associated translation inhibitor RaiA
MRIPLQISYEDLEPSAAIEARIEREAAKLERLAHGINRCHVMVAGPSGNRRHGDLFRVHIRITAPGHVDVVAGRNPDADHAHEDVQVAIRDAFNALRRRLQDRSRRRAGADQAS